MSWTRYLLIYIVLATSAIAVTVALLAREQARDSVERAEEINSVLSGQKVCTAGSPEFCEALFDRLSDNITPAQQVRLTCAVVENLAPNSVRLAPDVRCEDAKENP